jgi:hypothetical protein
MGSGLPQALAPVVYLAAGLLAWSGIAKGLRPAPAADALRLAGLPAHTALVRALAGWELVVGLACLLRPATASMFALCATYLAFAGYLEYVIRTRPGSGSCGCTGAHRVPPSRLHVALDLVAAAAAAMAIVVPVASLPAFASSLGPLAVPFLGGLVLAGYLAWAAVRLVPEAFASYRGGEGHAHERVRGNRHRRADSVLAAAGIGPGHPSLWGGAEATKG